MRRKDQLERRPLGRRTPNDRGPSPWAPPRTRARGGCRCGRREADLPLAAEQAPGADAACRTPGTTRPGEPPPTARTAPPWAIPDTGDNRAPGSLSGLSLAE